MTMDLKAKIRHVPDFPKAGILFYDITTLLQDPAGFRAAVDGLSQPFTGQGIDVVDVHTLDASAGRAMTDRVLESIDCVRLAFRQRLDAAVRQIADPAVQSFALRHRLGKKSEADALDPAAHEVSSGDPQSKTALQKPRMIACCRLTMSRRPRG